MGLRSATDRLKSNLFCRSHCRFLALQFIRGISPHLTDLSSKRALRSPPVSLRNSQKKRRNVCRERMSGSSSLPATAACFRLKPRHSQARGFLSNGSRHVHKAKCPQNLSRRHYSHMETPNQHWPAFDWSWHKRPVRKRVQPLLS